MAPEAFAGCSNPAPAGYGLTGVLLAFGTVAAPDAGPAAVRYTGTWPVGAEDGAAATLCGATCVVLEGSPYRGLVRYHGAAGGDADGLLAGGVGTGLR